MAVPLLEYSQTSMARTSLGSQKFDLNMGSSSHSGSVIVPGQEANQGPVVQSVVSLTSSLRVISLTVLADSIHNILIFFSAKNFSIFAYRSM